MTQSGPGETKKECSYASSPGGSCASQLNSAQLRVRVVCGITRTFVQPRRLSEDRMAPKSSVMLSVTDRLNLHVELAEERLRSVQSGSALDNLIRPMVNEVKNRAAHTTESSAVPLLLRVFNDYNCANKNEVARLDVVFDSLWSHARTTGREAGLTMLSQQLRPKSDFRAVASALAEATVLGLLVRHWERAVELWPLVSADRENRSDCLVRLPDMTINVEIGAAWSRRNTRSWKPYGHGDAAWLRLKGPLRRKRPQFSKEHFNLFFWSPFVLADERSHGFYGPDGHRRFDSELSSLLREPARVGLQFQIAELDPRTGWLKRIYVCRRPQDSSEVHEWVADEVQRAFERLWFVRPEFEIRSISG